MTINLVIFIWTGLTENKKKKTSKRKRENVESDSQNDTFNNKENIGSIG